MAKKPRNFPPTVIVSVSRKTIGQDRGKAQVAHRVSGKLTLKDREPKVADFAITESVAEREPISD